jgi:hypothetical protein
VVAVPSTASATLQLSQTGASLTAIEGDGSSGATGVTGMSDTGYGVYGRSQSHEAVLGNSPNAIGVRGTSTNGVGVWGNSVFNLGGVFVGGQAPIQLVPAGSPGAPSSGTHAAGEIYVDSTAALWVCVAGGTPGHWVKLAAPQYGYAGGAINFLSVPIRLLDTRAGATVGNDRPNAPVAYHGTINVPAAGVTYSGQTIPAGATAVFGLLTAALAPGVTCGDGSSAIAYAAGATRPAAINVVFNPQDLHGAYTANFTVVPTGSGGDFSLYSQPINPVGVDYLFDCFGFVM